MAAMHSPSGLLPACPSQLVHEHGMVNIQSICSIDCQQILHLLLCPFPGQGGGWWSALHTSLLACPPAFLSSHPGCGAITVSRGRSWPPCRAGSGRCSHPSWGEAKPQAAVTSASPASSQFVAFAVEFLFSLGSPYPSTSGSAWASSHAKTWSLCLGQGSRLPLGMAGLILISFWAKSPS